MSRCLHALTGGVVVSVALALGGCAGPTVQAKPTAASAGKPAASAPAKAPGPYVANGDADASSGKASTQLLDTMKFSPNTLTKVKAGSSVTVDLKNAGLTLHNFVSPALGVASAIKVDPGKSGSVTFTAPATAGTYPFWCNEPGHAEAGMTGQVVVE